MAASVFAASELPAWAQAATNQAPTTLSQLGNQRLSTVTVISNAPIYVVADAARDPIRVAKAGSVLLLLDSTPEWDHVQFEDPQYGRRAGYIEAKFVRNHALDPVDVSISEPPQTATPRRQAPLQSPTSRDAPPVDAQMATPSNGLFAKSRAAGFFIGFGYEGAAIVTDVTDTVSGPGGSLVLGYGFNPTWSLYVESSAADLDGATLGHFDIGARAHFLAPVSRAVPFVQFGLSGRAIVASGLTVSGGGISFGGGLNAHFTPGFAFSGAVDWSVGTFSQARVGSIRFTGADVRAVSARVHLGLIWFPQTSHNQGHRTGSFVSW